MRTSDRAPGREEIIREKARENIHKRKAMRKQSQESSHKQRGQESTEIFSVMFRMILGDVKNDYLLFYDRQLTRHCRSKVIH